MQHVSAIPKMQRDKLNKIIRYKFKNSEAFLACS